MTDNIMQQHPITPPPELLQQWITEALSQDYCAVEAHVVAQAAQWGADQELEACCEWMDAHSYFSASIRIREDRRPKPPSPKEQALADLDRLIALIPKEGALAMAESIRCALEQLEDN